MSHYAVAVFSDEPSYDEFCRLLEPYDENDESRYVFEPVTQEELAEAWKKFLAQNPSWKYDTWLHEMYHEKDGAYGHWYNPHGYYDYYSIDGRSYMFDLQEQIDSDEVEWPMWAKKSQIDWNSRGDDDRTEEELRNEWQKFSVEGDRFYSSKYYIERFGDEDTYVRQSMHPMVPYAFITPDGEWHAPGRVGWFALSDETPESCDKYLAEWDDFILNAPDCYVSLVDCHI